MKSITAFLMILITIALYNPVSYATTIDDAGYEILISILTENVGAPIEYIDDSDMFTNLDSINFITKKSSVFAIFDFEKEQISVGYRLKGKQTKMSIWENLSVDEIYTTGYLVLENYKEINSKSEERFAYSISDNENSLYIDSVAEANPGIKKYGSLFRIHLIGIAVSTQMVFATPIATATPQITITPSVTATPRATATPRVTTTPKKEVSTTVYSNTAPKKVRIQGGKEVSSGINYGSFMFWTSLLILCFALMCTLLIAKKTEETVKQFSTPYNKLCTLNSTYHFHRNLPRTLVITHYFNSKQSLERANSQVLIPILLYNDSRARKVYTGIKENRSLYNQYLSEYRSAVTSDYVIQKSGIKSMRFRQVESKLCDQALLTPQRDVEIEIHFEYISRGGRNHYSRLFKENYNSLKKSFSKMNEMESSRVMAQFERAKMSDKLRYEILTRDGHRCTICGATAADGVKLHVDHIIPVSKGGKTEYSNLRTLCERCNLGKGARYHEGELN